MLAVDSPIGPGPLLAVRASAFLSHCTRHLLMHSYRQGIAPDGGFRVRIRVAAYDSFINLLLDGYSQLAGHPIRVQTGGLIVRLNRLIAAVDDEYETRLASRRPLDFGEVIGTSSVKVRVGELADFLRPYPERRAIRDFLYDQVGQSYHTYVSLATSAASQRDGSWHFQTALLDSAGLAGCVAHVIGLFHDKPASEEIVSQFSAFGMMGKLADDVIDFWDDLEADRANVLLGILHAHAAEREKMLRDSGASGRPSLRWWRENCPKSYADVAELISDHRDRLTSPRILLACDLVLLSAWYGRIANSSPTIGLHQ